MFWILVLTTIILLRTQQEIITDGLITHLPFNGNAKDVVGDNDGTVSGATLDTDRNGAPDSSYTFDGGDSITIDNDPSWFGNDFSISFWFKTSSTSNIDDDCWDGKVLVDGDIAGNNDDFFVGINNKGRVCFAVGDTTGANDIYTDGIFADGIWHHVAAVRRRFHYSDRNPRMYIYVDGERLVSETYSETTYTTAATKLSLGSNLVGNMDDIRFYDRSLNYEEIKSIYLGSEHQESMIDPANHGCAEDPLAQCLANSNPPKCSTCCITRLHIDYLKKLQACVSGDDDYVDPTNGKTYDFSDVYTIYVEGGMSETEPAIYTEFELEIDRNGKSEKVPMKLLPYPKTHVRFTSDSSCAAVWYMLYSGSNDVSNWQFGSEDGTIMFDNICYGGVTSKDVQVQFGGVEDMVVAGYQNLYFLNIKFWRINDIEFNHDGSSLTDTVYQDSTIRFEKCHFLNDGRDLKFKAFDFERGTFEFEDCVIFARSNKNTVFSFYGEVKVSFNKNLMISDKSNFYFKFNNYETITQDYSTLDATPKLYFENCIVEAYYLNSAQKEIEIQMDGIDGVLHLINNLFLSKYKFEIKFDNNERMDEMLVLNNVIVANDEFDFDWQYYPGMDPSHPDYLPCSSADKCKIQSNYIFANDLDLYGNEDLPDYLKENSVFVDHTDYMDRKQDIDEGKVPEYNFFFEKGVGSIIFKLNKPYQDIDFKNGRLEIKTGDGGSSYRFRRAGYEISSVEYMLNQKGLEKYTPALDITGRVRKHTTCPYKVGPFSDCGCDEMHYGPKCQFETIHREAETQYVHPVRGSLHAWSNSYDNLLSGDETRRREEERLFEDILIRDVCINEYWMILIDENFDLWMAGENIDNDYILRHVGSDEMRSSSFFKVNREEDVYENDWKATDLPDTISAGTKKWRHEYEYSGEMVEVASHPVKVFCTESSMFVLTHNMDLYVLGRSDDHEVDGDQKLTSFHLTKKNVLNVETSYHTAYILMNDIVGLHYCRDKDGVDGGGSGQCESGSVDRTDMYRIEAIGANHFGCLGSNYELPHTSGQYELIDYAFVFGGTSELVVMDYSGNPNDLKWRTDAEHYDKYDPKPWNFVIPELEENEDPMSLILNYYRNTKIELFPKMKAMQYGFWVSYKVSLEDGKTKNYHFYTGMDHPSTGEHQSNLTLINFVDSEYAAMENDDMIDFVDRIIDKGDESQGGCMYLISNEKIYVSGNKKCSYTNGITPNQEYPFPQEIQSLRYGEYVQSARKRILKFECGYACYIVQTTGEIYMFGKSNNGIGIDAMCADNQCRHIMKASEGGHLPSSMRREDEKNVVDVIVGLGDSVPVAVYNPTLPDSQKVLNEQYDLFGFIEPSVFNTFDDNVVYKFAPELILPDSGMEDNLFTIVLRKKEVYMQLESTIYWAKKSTVTGLWEQRNEASEEITYPYLSSQVTSLWEHWNVDLGVEEGGPYDYYKLSLSWTDFNYKGKWDHSAIGEDYDSDGSRIYFDSYKNRLVFAEEFYLGVEFGEQIYRTEEFVFDFEIRFPKQILETTITVQQDEFSDYWDAYIVDKTFDRETRIGEIEFSTVTRFPNFLVFADLAAKALSEENYHHLPEGVSAYTFVERLGEVTPNNPEYFKTDEDVYYVEEVGTDTTPKTIASRRSLSCDSKNCYQSWKLSFRIIDDYRVCHVPLTSFPINWVQFCLIDQMEDEYDMDTDGDTEGNHEDCVNPSREIQFLINLKIENLCGGELIETIETDFSLTIYSDWTYDQEIDTETHIFNVGDWVYFKAEVSSEEVLIESTIIDTITWLSSDGVIQHLYYKDTSGSEPVYMRTPMGEIIKLVIDVIDDSNTEVGFHFKLHNELLRLQPGDKQTYSIEVYLSLMYKGNDEEVTPQSPDYTPRRESINIGNTMIKKMLDVTILNNGKNAFSAVPYIVASVAIVGSAIVLGALIVIAIVTGVMTKKKVGVFDGVKKDDIVFELGDEKFEPKFDM